MNQLLSANSYNISSWGQKFPDNIVNFDDLYIHDSWIPLFETEKKKPYFKKIEKFLSHCLKKTSGKIDIFPYPDLVFSSLNKTPLDKVKVVILGQDPYPKKEKNIPQAMGMSFSVPVGLKIPSSLQNIYKNMIRFKIIDEMPKHGNLDFWCYQGCLMLNAALTVQSGHPNSHAKKWAEFTDVIIKYISDNCENIVFVLWGKFALSKLDQGLIDQDKHKVIVSSHPSGLSNRNTMRSNKTGTLYKSFNDTNHFGEINNYLKNNEIGEILWNIR